MSSHEEEEVDRSVYKFKVTLPSGKKMKFQSAQLPTEEFFEIQKLNGDLLSGSSQSSSEPSQVIAWKKHQIENYLEYLKNPTIWTTPNLNNPWHLPSQRILLNITKYGPNQTSLLIQFRAWLCNQTGSGVDINTQLEDLPFNLPNSNSSNSWIKQWIGIQKVKAGSEIYQIREERGVNRIHVKNAGFYTCEFTGCFSRRGPGQTTCCVHAGSHKFYAAAVYMKESFSQQTAKYLVHSCHFLSNPDASDEEKMRIFDNVTRLLYFQRVTDSTDPKLAFVISQSRLEVQKFVCAWTYAIFLASMQPYAPDRPKISLDDIGHGDSITIYLPNLCEEQMATILRDNFKVELRVKRLSKEDWAATDWPNELGVQVQEERQYSNHPNGNIYIMDDQNVTYGGLNLSIFSKSNAKDTSIISSPYLYQKAFNTKLCTRSIIIPTPLPDPEVEWTPDDEAKLEKDMRKIKSTNSRRASTESGKKKRILEAKKKKELKPLYEKELRRIEAIIIFSLQNLALFQLPRPDRSPLSNNQMELDHEKIFNMSNINKECLIRVSEIDSNLFALSNAYCKFMTGFFFELVQID